MLGVKSITNCFALVIDEIINEAEDYVTCYMIDNEGKKTKKTKNKIYYNLKSEAFFNKYNRRHYLSEFTNTNI